MKRLLLFMVPAGVLFATACSDQCDDVDWGLWTCGEVGVAGGRIDGGTRGNWPPAVADGTAVVAIWDWLVEVDPSEQDGPGDTGWWGEPRDEESILEGEITTPPARYGETLYAGTENGNSDYLHGIGADAFDDNVDGDLVVPPTIGDTLLYVTVGSTRTSIDVEVRNRKTGEHIETYSDQGRVAIASDDSLRVLASRDGLAFTALLAKSADMSETLWIFDHPDGIIDIALGPDDDTLLVTANGELIRVDASGNELWTYTPDCAPCVIPVAPTVTADRALVPVWVNTETAEGCRTLADTSAVTVDQLHAISLDNGQLHWAFDSFPVQDSVFSPSGSTTDPFGQRSFAVAGEPFFSGAPAVADDGTIYAPGTGSVVVLSPDGTERGRLLFNQEVEDVEDGCTNTLVRRHVMTAPTPVLDSTGTLWLRSAWETRWVVTDKPGASIPWAGPFGNTRNTSRVGAP